MNRNRIDLATMNERILVVDDEQEMLGLLQFQLFRFGLKTDLATNGKEAVELLTRNDYGLVITDIEMPEMDGMELMRHIQDSYPHTDVLVVSGYSKRYSFVDVIAAGAADFIAKPFKSDELKAKLQRIFRERNLVTDLAQAKEKEKSFFLHIVESLAISLDEKDQYTHGHSRRVTNLALQLAEQVTEEVVDLDLLRLCGILHDIGKIGVPDSILANPNRLSDEEFEIIKKHPAQGAHILQPMESDERISKISKIIRYHHERFDGTGYPGQLQGRAIPLLARIIAIADSYDAMTSDRPYRKALSADIALEEIQKHAGSQFDPVLAEKFISLTRNYQDSVPCSRLHSCKIFNRISKDDVSRAYKTQYCCANFRACARFKIGEEVERPANLLPDGSFVMESDSKQCVTS
jgi:cyclic di-GMP phosphodiesterase